MNVPDHSIAPASQDTAAPSETQSSQSSQSSGPPPPTVESPAVAATRKMRSLGSAALALAIIDLCGDGYGLVSKLIIGPLMNGEKHLLALMPGPRPREMDALIDQTAHFMNRIMLWNTLRLVPYAVASVLLLRIAGSLKRGDRDALARAQTWSLGAFGVIAFSLALQLGVIVPLTQAYQQAMFALQPPNSPPGIAGFQDAMRSVSSIMSYAGPLLGAAIMAIWPTVLRISSRRLQRA